MEKVFDLREFLITIYEKCKNFVAFILIIAMLGALYGASTNQSNVYVSQSSSSVNLTQYEKAENDGLDIIMGNIRETVTGDYFYIGILNELNSLYDEEELSELMQTAQNPSLTDLKSTLNIYTNGNTILVEVKANNSVTAQKFSNSIRELTVKKLVQNIQNITISIQDQYVYNQMLQTGNTLPTRVLKYTLAGAGAGIVITILYTFFFEVMDTKVKSTKDLQKYNLPILGELTQGDEPND